MVVIVDLDDAAPSLSPLRAPHAPGIPLRKPLHHSLQPLAGGDDNTRSTVASTNTSSGSESERPAGAAGERPNPNVNGFSAALSCYPVVRQLAAQLDLNTLHSLSRTCRQFRANLLEYRDQLIKHTLHCEFEQTDQGQRLGSRLREAQFSYNSSRQLTSGRVGKCARDMVGECQRCAAIVCRNCTMKPPPTPTLRTRHRRLCRTCTKTPLHLLTACQRLRSADSGTPSPPSSPNPRPLIFDDEETRAFTAPAFERTPCTCDTVVWLCQPCGKELRTADTMYIRGWTWRTRYSHYLGGVGTGAGEGNEGVECGRGPSCLAAKIVEHEIDCDADTLATIEGTSQSPDRWKGSSYLAQEIEGVGGVFKMKSKKQVRVGECVKVYEDEKDRSIMFLERENAGKLRSWCSWCERVVLGEKDKAGKSGARPGSSGSNSTASSRSST